MPVVNFYNLGSVGIVKDIPPHLLPPEAWTDGINMRMQDGMVKRWFEPAQVFGTPSVAPGFVMSVPGVDEFFWLYADLAAAYAYDGIAHTNITRGAGPYTAQEYRDWNGCILGGVPILNNGSDVPQYWPDLSVATQLANLTNWPSTLRAKVVRNFGTYLVALNLVDSGDVLAHALRWSDSADPGTIPGSWDVTDPAVDAGQTHLTDVQGGQILDGVLLGNYLAIYKERSTHLMRFVGVPDVFGFELLLNQGLLASRCAALIDSGLKHFCVGEDDVYVHSGTKSVDYPLDRKTRRTLYSEIDSTNFRNSFAFNNPGNEEAWFAYPTEGAEFPNRVMTWNYRTGEVSFRDFVGASVDAGVLPVASTSWDALSGSWDALTSSWNTAGSRKIVAGDPVGNKFYAQDYELTPSSPNALSYVQRTGIAVVGKDRQGQPKADYHSRKLFKRVWSKISGNAIVEMRMGVQDTIKGDISWGPYQTVPNTERFLDIDPPLNGVFGAIEYRSTSPAFWQLEGYDLDLEVVSEY